MDLITASTQVFVISGVYLEPLISSGTKSVTVTLVRSTFPYATQQLSLASNPNLLSQVSITPQSTTVSQLTSYNFTFTTYNSLGINAQIQIILPTQLFIAIGACSATVSSLNYQTRINSSFGCTAVNNLTISITTINTILLPSGTILTFVVSNIRNSFSTTQTSPFTLYTYYSPSSTDVVDQSINVAVTMTPGTIGICTVSSSSSMVFANSVYTFAYTVKTLFLANS